MSLHVFSLSHAGIMGKCAAIAIKNMQSTIEYYSYVNNSKSQQSDDIKSSACMHTSIQTYIHTFVMRTVVDLSGLSLSRGQLPGGRGTAHVYSE